MKKVAKWIGIWIIWIIAVSVIMLVVAKPIFNKCYNDYYTTVVTERNGLYSQVDSLENDFDEVYNMRNAEIINSEEPVIILEDERFTLEVRFDKNRTEILGIEETRQVTMVFWIFASLFVATLLYIVYSIGKARKKVILFGGTKRKEESSQK